LRSSPLESGKGKEVIVLEFIVAVRGAEEAAHAVPELDTTSS
jgi:hypothetical protein